MGRSGTAGGLLLRFPATVLLVMLLIFNDLAATGKVSVGPIASVILLPVLLLSYVVDPVGALATRFGLPCSGAVEAGLLVFASLCFDWAMRRAAE